MRSADARKLMKKALLNAKSDGLRVFINKVDERSYYYPNFGILTDGINIVSVQFGRYGNMLFVTVFNWIPSRENGTGCQTCEDGYGYKTLTRNIFSEAVSYGRNAAVRWGAKPYRDFEHYLMRNKDFANRYIEL